MLAGVDNQMNHGAQSGHEGHEGHEGGEAGGESHQGGQARGEGHESDEGHQGQIVRPARGGFDQLVQGGR